MLWFTKRLYPLVLEFRNGRLQAVKGKLPGHILRETESLLANEPLTRATLHRDRAGRWHFSSAISSHLHQRLRNLLSQG